MTKSHICNCSKIVIFVKFKLITELLDYVTLVNV